jgi:hypothetical protein
LSKSDVADPVVRAKWKKGKGKVGVAELKS